MKRRATRKELIDLLTQVVTRAELSHTEKCRWEELGHGGDCACAVGVRNYTTPRYPGLKAVIEETLETEKRLVAWIKHTGRKDPAK